MTRVYDFFSYKYWINTLQFTYICISFTTGFVNLLFTVHIHRLSLSFDFSNNKKRLRLVLSHKCWQKSRLHKHRPTIIFMKIQTNRKSQLKSLSEFWTHKHLNWEFLFRREINNHKIYSLQYLDFKKSTDLYIYMSPEL